MPDITTAYHNGEYRATAFGYDNVAYGPTPGTAKSLLTREIMRQGTINKGPRFAKRECIRFQFASANRGTRAPYRGTGTMPKPR